MNSSWAIHEANKIPPKSFSCCNSCSEVSTCHISLSWLWAICLWSGPWTSHRLTWTDRETHFSLSKHSRLRLPQMSADENGQKKGKFLPSTYWLRVNDYSWQGICIGISLFCLEFFWCWTWSLPAWLRTSAPHSPGWVSASEQEDCCQWTLQCQEQGSVICIILLWRVQASAGICNDSFNSFSDLEQHHPQALVAAVCA